MNQQDNFSSGFLLGSALGGILGGLVGALLVSRRDLDALSHLPEEDPSPETLPSKPSKQKLPRSDRYQMQTARHNLDEKIAQLNEAIDEVREQLSHVNGNGKGEQKVSGQPTNGEVFYPPR